jgi:phage shock protein A
MAKTAEDLARQVQDMTAALELLTTAHTQAAILLQPYNPRLADSLLRVWQSLEDDIRQLQAQQATRRYIDKRYLRREVDL